MTHVLIHEASTGIMFPARKRVPMTPAEKRIKELIDRWITSIELHLRYAELSDEAYWKVQSWPKHDRPTRWVLESARQKANELRSVFDSRHGMGDSRFADALELMSFLANLVGAQHVDRFIPLAEPKAESVSPPKPAPPPVAQPSPPPPPQLVRVAQPAPAPAPQPTRAPPTSDVPSWYMQAQAAQAAQPRPIAKPSVHQPAAMAPPAATPKEPDPDATREMPRPTRQSQAAPSPVPEVPRRTASDQEATREMPKLRTTSATSTAKSEPPKKPAAAKPPPSAPAKQNAKSAAAPSPAHQTVINDAVRLMGWGRTWHELAELIARMADRPSQAEIRKILRAHRATIEKSAKG